jgi:signal transduction histidine kinase
MVLFGHRSIRRDLVVIIMTVSLLSILLTSFFISLTHYYNYRDMLKRDAELSAISAAKLTRPLLGFEGASNVKQRLFAELGVLANNESVALGCLYDRAGKLIAFFDAANANITQQSYDSATDKKAFARHANAMLAQYSAICPPAPLEAMPQAKPDMLILRELIHDNGNGVMGVLYTETSKSQAFQRLLELALTTFAICAGALFICYLLAIRLQRTISDPISKLSQATRNVVVYRDYSVRVENKKGNYSTDVVQLIDSFNAMMKDIGERDSKLQRKNLELERAKETAESANLSKSQFLANISHELRTPLNAIIGFSSIIINQMFGPVGNDKYVDYGKDINDSGVHLLDIINDILDLSKAEAGKLSLRLEEFDVLEAMRKCQHIMAERAADAEVTISLQIPTDMPMLVADRVRFIQIMLNLISNSIKFTESGGRIDIHAEYEPAGDEVHYFTLRVQDTGIGMRKEDIDMAFQTFGQVDSGLDRKYEGTGLGLPLTKKLVELHNGSIRIDSALHQGTTISIRLISDKALL